MMPAATQSGTKPAWHGAMLWKCCVVEVKVERPVTGASETHGASQPQETDSGTAEVELKVIPYRVVEFTRSADERVQFTVHRDGGGRLTFTDKRDRSTGIAGVTGLWGTLPPPRPARPRSMTASAFKREAVRFVGPETAGEIVRYLESQPRG
jgi:hypothetical protein